MAVFTEDQKRVFDEVWNFNQAMHQAHREVDANAITHTEALERLSALIDELNPDDLRTELAQYHSQEFTQLCVLWNFSGLLPALIEKGVPVNPSSGIYMHPLVTAVESLDVFAAATLIRHGCSHHERVDQYLAEHKGASLSLENRRKVRLIEDMLETPKLAAAYLNGDLVFSHERLVNSSRTETFLAEGRQEVLEEHIKNESRFSFLRKIFKQDKEQNNEPADQPGLF